MTDILCDCSVQPRWDPWFLSLHPPTELSMPEQTTFQTREIASHSQLNRWWTWSLLRLHKDDLLPLHFRFMMDRLSIKVDICIHIWVIFSGFWWAGPGSYYPAIHTYTSRYPKKQVCTYKLCCNVFFLNLPLCICPVWNRAELGTFPLDRKKTEKQLWCELWGGWYDDKSTEWVVDHERSQDNQVCGDKTANVFTLHLCFESSEIRRCEDEVAYQRRRNHRLDSADSVCKTLAHASIIDF